MKKQTKLTIILGAVLAVLLAAVAVVLIFFPPKTDSGDKNITFTVVYADKTEKEYEISTDAEYLGQAVYEEGLVSEEEYKTGYYLTIDGVTTNYDENQSWWCIKHDGEMTNYGMNELPIKDGDEFEAVYTIG